MMRRRAVLGSLMLAGCSTLTETYESITGDAKPKLPGERVPILAGTAAPTPEAPADAGPVALPRPAPLAEWPVAGGTPGHAPGHIAAADQLAVAWRSSVGDGAGYRARLPSPPVTAGGRLYAMDSNAQVTGLDAAGGGRAWRVDARPDNDSTGNLGGGVAIVGETVFAATGLAELLALDAATGAIRWRAPLPGPARGAPSIAEGGRVCVPVIDSQLVACSPEDGHVLWSYRGQPAIAGLFGAPSPAVDGGLLVAGFPSGELVCLRADSGRVVWSDSLGASGHESVSDLSAIRGLPVIDRGLVHAISVAGQFTALDLRAGRRVWEREVAGQETPCVVGDYIFTLSTQQVLSCVGREDGRIRWLRELPAYGDTERRRDPISWTGPLLVSDRLVVAGTTSEALAISPYTGEIIGRQRLPGRCTLSPIAAAGTVFLLTDDATVVALR